MALPTLSALVRPKPRKARDGESEGASPASQAARKSQIAKAGRIALWLFIVVVMFRGITGILGGDSSTAPVTRASTVERFPDTPARAFAEEFARVYLTWLPGDGPAHAERISPFLSEEVRAAAVVQIPERGTVQTVSGTTVARAKPGALNRALVTVAVNVSRRNGARRTRVTVYLAVPVARDATGGLAVYDRPAFTAPPTQATGVPPEGNALQGAAEDQRAIDELVNKFLTAYLSGQSDQLSFYTPPGTQITPLGSPLDLTRITTIQQIGDLDITPRILLVQALVRDPRTRAIYPLTYRLDAEYTDRWLIKRVEGGGP